MQLQSEEQAIVAEVARQLGVAPERLAGALEQESAVALAHVLGIGEAEAAERLQPISRVVAFGDDWAAGCWLLTDEMRDELRTALWSLLPAAQPASPGVSGQ
jgi:hypothetical protein